MAANTTAYDFLTKGELTESFLTPYKDILTIAGVNWFWVIVYTVTMLLIYNKTQDITIPTIVSVIVGGYMSFLLPAEFMRVGYLLLTLSLVVLLLKIFKD